VALVSGGELDSARYNILGIHPWLSLVGRGNELHVTEGSCPAVWRIDPLEGLREILRRLSIPLEKRTGIPASLPIAAGLMGYLAYDLKDCIEELPRTSVDDLNLPLMVLFAHRVIVVEDRRERARWVCRMETSETASNHPETDLGWWQTMLDGCPPSQRTFAGDSRGFTAGFTRPLYEDAVRRIREYIAAGDVYQVNMSQRFTMPFEGSAFSLFEALYRKNPAPFFAYVHAQDHFLVSTSPERFIQRIGERVETRPIKGTRPRGKTETEDQRLQTDLVNSPKDDAELSMIVDLLRNDIGKVCRAGTVSVTAHKRVEAYRNVYHLVSVVEGRLEPEADAVDLIQAVFPGGSITGCPKIRAMEIIDELEPVRRHIYTGSIGYISFHDTLDLSIAIRTATVCRGRILFSVGGGIVYDSDPADEYEETLHKGQTLMEIFEDRPTVRQVPGFAWFNGRIIPEEDAHIPATGPGARYGFGIFETIRANGGQARFLDAHLERFYHSWQELFQIPPADITWDAVIAQVLEANRLAESVAVVNLLAIRRRPEEWGAPVDLAVLARPYRHRLDRPGPPGLRLAVYPHPRQSPLADHKTCNYLYYHTASRWAKDHGADEALILNPDGTVSEGATANLLVIRGQTVCIPRSPHVLAGIMERKICQGLSASGYSVRKEAVTILDLFSADQVILSNSLMGPVSAVSLDGKPLPAAPDFTAGLRRRLLGSSSDGYDYPVPGAGPERTA
jgi:para-aminobenzoate synthetase component 1